MGRAMVISTGSATRNLPGAEGTARIYSLWPEKRCMVLDLGVVYLDMMKHEYSDIPHGSSASSTQDTDQQ